MYKTYLDNGYQEIEIEVNFDYEPYEKSTLEYPGASEAVAINDVRVVDTNAELCLIGDAEGLMEEEVMDFVHDEQGYASYGYMLD